MKFRNIFLVLKKELTDAIRDKRTLISMIVVPIVVMPLLSLGVFAVISSQMEKLEEKATILGYLDLSGTGIIKEFLDTPLSEEDTLQIKYVEAKDKEDMELLVNEKNIQVGLIIPEDFKEKLESDKSSEVILFYDKSRPESDIALKKIRSKLIIFSRQVTQSRLMKLKLDHELINPLNISYKDLSTPSKMGGSIIGLFLPYMMLLLCVAGASNPAMDITAGEKERGTLETILVSPASISEITYGKLFTIQTLSMITTFLILLSYFAIFRLGLFNKMMDQQLQLTVTLKDILLILILFLPMTMFVSSVLLAVNIYARSLKEAQSYMAPIMIATIFPAMVSLVPGLDNNIVFSLVPVMNLSITIKSIITHDLNLTYFIITLVSTLIYAIITTYFAVWQFHREVVLFRSSE